jgi:hypothetical protein
MLSALTFFAAVSAAAACGSSGPPPAPPATLPNPPPAKDEPTSQAAGPSDAKTTAAPTPTPPPTTAPTAPPASPTQAACRMACTKVSAKCKELVIDECVKFCDDVATKFAASCGKELQALGMCALKADKVTCQGPARFDLPDCKNESTAFKDCQTKHK